MPIAVSTKASHYPITLEEAKEHLRVTDTNSDSYIQGLIAAVTAHVENVTGRTLITTEYIWKFDDFPCSRVFHVPKPPLQAVSSITYVDTNESTQVWGSTYYSIDTVSQPGRIILGYQQIWPIVLRIPHAVTVTFTAGYGSHLGAVPEAIKHAMKFLIAHNWSNRQEVVIEPGRLTVLETPKASDWLLTSYLTPFFEGF